MRNINTTSLPQDKELLIQALPPLLQTMDYMEMVCVQELDRMKDTLLLLKLESWPGVMIESSYTNKTTQLKAKFLE